MTKKSLHIDRRISRKLHRFVQELLDDGFGAAEVSFSLAEASVTLGLELAPDRI
jgi:hypothetical protein